MNPNKLKRLDIFFKNIAINYPARYFPQRLNVLLLRFYGFGIRLFGNQKALRNVKLLEPKLGVYRLTFWNGDSWLMVNHVRINRYLKGIEGAGERLLCRYNLNRINVKVDCFVDVGANVGEISYLYAKRGAKVICFEPDPNLREILESNLGGFSDVHISTSALGKTTGPAEIMIATETADTSLIPRDGDAKKASVAVSRYDQHLFCDMVEGVAILKMDTEGFEPEAIDGFGAELSKFSLIAIDCGLEREGESTASAVEELIKRADIFDVSVSKNLILTARRFQNKNE